MTDYPKYSKIWPDGVLEAAFEVSAEHTDGTDKMTLAGAARAIEFATERHLGVFGLGVPRRKELGLLWVVEWDSVRVCRLPALGERVRIWIWPGKNRSVLCPRRYVMYDENYDPIIGAGTYCLFIDAKKRTIAVPPAEIKKMPVTSLAGEPPLPDVSVYIPDDMKEYKEKTVTPEDIDWNVHMNNTKYVKWVESLMRDAVGEDVDPKGFWIQYSKEITEGQKLRIYYEHRDGYFYVRGKTDTYDSFLARVDLK